MLPQCSSRSFISWSQTYLITTSQPPLFLCVLGSTSRTITTTKQGPCTSSLASTTRGQGADFHGRYQNKEIVRKCNILSYRLVNHVMLELPHHSHLALSFHVPRLKLTIETTVSLLILCWYLTLFCCYFVFCVCPDCLTCVHLSVFVLWICIVCFIKGNIALT